MRDNLTQITISILSKVDNQNIINTARDLCVYKNMPYSQAMKQAAKEAACNEFSSAWADLVDWLTVSESY
jgi:hypothetical protein